MGLLRGQNIKIYNVDPTDDTIQQLIMPGQVERLVHDTRLPGGFWLMKFQMPMTDAAYWDWRINRQWVRARLQLGSSTLLSEGRLQRYEGPINAPTLVFGGYYNNFRDSVNDNKTYSKTYNTTAKLIIQDMLSNGFHADTLQVNNTNFDNIEDAGVTINQTYGLESNLWDVLTNPTNGVLNTGDTADRIVDFGVWDDRIVYLKARNPSVVTWKAYRSAVPGGVRGTFAPRVNLMGLHNAVTTLYNVTSNAGGVDQIIVETETGVSSDAASISAGLRRELVVRNIGESVSGPAVSRSAVALASAKDAQQEVDSIVVTKVFDVNGIVQPLCKVRAGDVLQISDLVPTSSGLGSVALDGFRTFFISQTSCVHERGELIIRPDRESKSLDARLGRNQIL
jgi:hypothetical protein